MSGVLASDCGPPRCLLQFQWICTRIVVRNVQNEAAARKDRINSMKLQSIQQAVELLNHEWHDDTPDWLVPYRNALYEVVPSHEVGKPPFFARGRTALHRHWAWATA